MSRRRKLVVAAIAVAALAAVGAGGWEFHRLDTSRPLAWEGGEGGGDFYKHGITPYSIPDDAYGPYAGRDVEVMPVGSGPGWLGFSIYNNGEHAVTITGLAHSVQSDPAGHLRITALLSPAGYQGDQPTGAYRVSNPRSRFGRPPSRPTSTGGSAPVLPPPTAPASPAPSAS